MLDFGAIARKEKTMAELCGHLTIDELRDLTNEMADMVLGLIADCTDADVTFVPVDPEAQDDYAENADEVNLPWTLGHVIVHATATAEESAFLAAELARGVQRAGRSRAEVPWQSITTIAQCRERIKESRRMRLASLEMWPAVPYLDNTVELRYLPGPINPPARFCTGLSHASGHVSQMVEIIRQAKAARA
jgi:hypothetical protein